MASVSARKPYICRIQNISPALQALNNYEGYNKFTKNIEQAPTLPEEGVLELMPASAVSTLPEEKVLELMPASAVPTIDIFLELFHEITNNSFYILKVIPAAMHVFVQRDWFTEIDCKHDNSLFVIKDNHIFNYIFYDGVWWKVDTEAEQLEELQLGLGTDYCLIPIRKNCADDFLKVLRSWKPIDNFYKEIQIELVMSLYNQKLERSIQLEDDLDGAIL